MTKGKLPKDGRAKDAEVDDDVVFNAPDTEELEIADVEENLAESLRQCKEKLKICQQERQEYLDGWQRSRADHLNYKQRLEAERRHEMERQTAYFIEKLLPLCDSFDLALQGLETEKGARNEWRAGIEQTYNQLLGMLKSYHVEVLEPKGVLFDPHFHEAISEIPVTDSTQHHIILDVLQKGYHVGERLIRPAKVVVGNYQADVKESE